MKKVGYYVKKFFVCNYFDDANGKSSALENMTKLCLLDKSKEKEIVLEINKIKHRLEKFLSDDKGEEKTLELIESFRKEIEKEEEKYDDQENDLKLIEKYNGTICKN